MKTRLVFVLSALVVVLSLVFVAGCSSGNTTPAAASPSVAPPPASTSQPSVSGPITVNTSGQQGIWVNGQGIIRVVPDIANLSLGVSVQASRVADAQAQAAADMDKVMKALTSNGVAAKDISTQYFNISQLTRYDNSTQQNVVTGYQVSNTVNVVVRNISQTGMIIDAVAAAAGDSTRFNGISFSVDNPQQYYSQARTAAMADAKAKADQLASLAGVTLGRPVYITESSAGAPTPIVVRPGLPQGAPDVSTPISPGQTDITLNVQVTYAIQ